ncbi:unnamed protein product [Urochloa decumbens]|uniref:AAA+ ATPase domain-containing protein n=1 Tax=Urochloa decumbens TaxID=240449 RepID=A0ABC9FL90_9POAL
MAAALWTVLSAIVSVLSFIVVFTTKWFDPHFESFGYPFDTNRRIKDLITLVEELKEIKDDLCRLNPQPSWERDKGWFRSVHHTLNKVHQIKLLDDENQNSFFRKSAVGRKADAEAKRIKNLITEGRALFVAAKANPLPVHQIMPQFQQNVLIGMDSVIKRVFDFLGGSDSLTNGILCLRGACGTGKTSLLNLVRDSCSQMASFDFVIFVVATKECTVFKLQRAILASFGLDISMVSEESIATVIFNVLKDRSFLLLLDDLWARVDLEKVGVPLPLGSTHQFRRKLIFTTRSLAVCADMESAHNYISLEYLDAGDSWKLFEAKAGRANIYSHPQVPYLAAEIVAACGGLPIALCGIGRFMSIMKDPKDWLIAQCLKNSGITEILGFDNEMFQSFKLSYNHLDESIKDCFLVCSLFKKGASIKRERLISWWFGLGLLDVNGRSKAHFIINRLLAVGLLEKGDNDHGDSENSCIKVHPVIHDIFFQIVRECKKNWAPLSTFSYASNWQNFSSLTFLDFTDNNYIIEVPKAIRDLVKLQYLNLSGTKVTSVPFELFYLSELKFLYLRQMRYLNQLPCWVISRLNKLRVIDMFFDITALGSTNIHNLPHMDTPGQGYTSSLLLQIERSNTQLEIFGVCVHTTLQLEILGRLPRVCLRSLCIDKLAQEDNSQIANGEKMYLHNLCQIKNLTELSITRCDTLKEIVAQGDMVNNQFGLFPDLEYLVLGQVENVTWSNAGLNLRVVSLFDCAIKHASWLVQLPCLVELKVSRCHLMEQLVDTTMLSPDLFRDQAVVSFPQLTKLTMQMLPKLSAISDINCEFGNLSYLQVHVCHLLKSLCLQPANNQTKVTLWCSKQWWDELAWQSDVMKTHLIPTCIMQRIRLDT